MSNLASYRPIGDSLLHKISSLSWQRGLSNFYTEYIPFSFSTSTEYAQLCGQLIHDFYSHTNSPLSILELGAGNGIFAKKCIQALHAHQLDFDYTLAECSTLLTQELDSLSFVQATNVHTAVHDIQHLNIKPPASVSILNYVLDTCPVQTLEAYNNKLFAWDVSVNIKKNAELKVFTNSTLETWTQNHIQNWLSQPNPKHLNTLSRLNPCLDIKWEKRPVDPKSLDATGILSRWLETSTQDGFFNFSPLWWSILDALYPDPNTSTQVMLYDFCSTQPMPQLENTFGQFGCCYFYNIPFFLLETYCTTKNLLWTQTQYPEAENQQAIISHPDTASWLHKHPLLHQKEEPGHQQDYVQLFQKAQNALKQKHYDETIEICDLLIDDYEKRALNAFILKTKALRGQNKLKSALNTIKTALHASQNYDLLYLEQAYIYHALNNDKDLQTALENYFKYCSNNPQWDLLSLLSPKGV